jgi:hypothetical protein
MLMTKDRRPAIRTLRGWAISVLQEAGAIRECEEHGWMQDRSLKRGESSPLRVWNFMRSGTLLRHLRERGIA